MIEDESCPLCGVPLGDGPGPVQEGDCPVHGVVLRLTGADDAPPAGLLGQEGAGGLSVFSGDFGETLPVGTAGWRKVDAFTVSDSDRPFEIHGELDSFRSSQKLRYPDGATVEASGLAHEGGRARFVVHGLEPGHDALLIGRTDVMYAGGDLRLELAGQAIVFPDFPPDRRYRARNRAIPIPGEWITGETVEMTLGRQESTKDLSHFEFWVYQSRTPVVAEADPMSEDSLADGVVDDVGDAAAPASDDGPLETVDISPEAIGDPTDATPEIDPPTGTDDAAEPIDEPPPALIEPPAATPATDAPPSSAPADGPLGAEPDDESVESPAPTASPPASAQPPPESSIRRESESARSTPATAGEQKLVTITLAENDHPHGTAQAHLTDALRAGWRIGRMECMPGPRGGWLVVLLER